MKPEGWTLNMRCESAVEDLMQPSEEDWLIEDWGVELGEHFKEALRRKARAPWWSHEGAGRDAIPEVEAHEGTVEVMREGQDAHQDQVPKVPESSQKVRSPPPPQFRSLTPVRTKPELACDPIPQLPTTSREAFYRQDITDSKDILPISSLPAPPLLISIPFQRLASKTVQKIKAVTASQVLSPTRPITCFFCGLSLPAGTDQFQHQEVSDLDLGTEFSGDPILLRCAAPRQMWKFT